MDLILLLVGNVVMICWMWGWLMKFWCWMINSLKILKRFFWFWLCLEILFSLFWLINWVLWFLINCLRRWNFCWNGFIVRMLIIWFLIWYMFWLILCWVLKILNDWLRKSFVKMIVWFMFKGLRLIWWCDFWFWFGVMLCVCVWLMFFVWFRVC